MLTVRVLNGAGGYEPGEVTIRRTIELDSDKVSSFQEGIERARFWELPGPDTNLGLDGAQWVLEGVREGRYHVMDRWSPESGSYRDLCLLLLRFSEPSSGCIRIDGAAIRRTRGGRLVLSFPAKRGRNGREWPFVRPIDDETRRSIEAQVFAALGPITGEMLDDRREERTGR